MLKREFKTCKRCGKPYVQEAGGIVMQPPNRMDSGLCPSCRTKGLGGLLRKLTGQNDEEGEK